MSARGAERSAVATAPTAVAEWAKYISLDRSQLEAGPARRARSRPLAPFGGIGGQSHNTIAAMFYDGNTVIKNGFKFKEKEEEREDIE